jgi:dTDP-4-dehydrorhamnose reductase
MRILIAGCRGMLGTDLMEHFSQQPVIGLDRPQIDIADLDQCLGHVQELRPEIIINAAALTQVDYCESHEEEASLINGNGAGNLAKAAASVGAALVHYSTDYVFNGLKTEPYREEDLPNPLSVYGKSKLLGEELIRLHCKEHLILRTSWLFGLHGANFIATILKVAGKEKKLRVVNDQFGSPTYTKDLAAHTAHLIRAGCRGTYHLTNSGSCSWYELAVKCVELSGMTGVSVAPVTSEQFPRPAPRPFNSILANARLLREGLPEMRDWQQAAREYVGLLVSSPGYDISAYTR